MGLFGGVGSFLGIGGNPGKSALSAFERGSGAVAGRLRKFRPFRTTSALGTNRLFQEGDETKFDVESDFITRAADQFRSAQEGGSEDVLALLRQRANPEFDRQFGRLESRALQQGRLGLSVGDRGGTPEFESFFGARQQADLGFQLQALEESRRERSSLLGEIGGIQGLLSGQFQDLLGAESLQSGREVAAANLESGGLTASLQGRLGEAATSRSLFGGAISSVGVGPFSASF